jgi:hypothetical protein
VTIHGLAGRDGTVQAAPRGMVGSTPSNGTVQQDSGSLAKANATPFTVPSGTALTRIDLEGGAGSNDLDLYLFQDDGHPFDPSTDALVASSGTASADEQILGKIPPGKYWVVVDGFDVASGGGHYTLTTWNVAPTDDGNLTVTPPSQPVTSGQSFTVNGSWSGLDPSQVYFGWVRFTSGPQSARTLVTVRP